MKRPAIRQAVAAALAAAWFPAQAGVNLDANGNASVDGGAGINYGRSYFGPASGVSPPVTGSGALAQGSSSVSGVASAAFGSLQAGTSLVDTDDGPTYGASSVNANTYWGDWVTLETGRPADQYQLVVLTLQFTVTGGMNLVRSASTSSGSLNSGVFSGASFSTYLENGCADGCGGSVSGQENAGLQPAGYPDFHTGHIAGVYVVDFRMRVGQAIHWAAVLKAGCSGDGRDHGVVTCGSSYALHYDGVRQATMGGQPLAIGSYGLLGESGTQWAVSAVPEPPRLALALAGIGGLLTRRLVRGRGGERRPEADR